MRLLYIKNQAVNSLKHKSFSFGLKKVKNDKRIILFGRFHLNIILSHCQYLLRKTVWTFCERLTLKGLLEILFEQFKTHLESKNLIVNEGNMIDANFIVAPHQLNIREENQMIREG
jgi:hypothetical protein